MTSKLRDLAYLQTLASVGATRVDQDPPSKFVDDGVGLEWGPSKSKPKGRQQVTDLYSIEEKNGEWCVYDLKNEIVGEWDTEAEARDHANAMQDSDDVA